MPKPYTRKMPATWWLQKRSYLYFMLRELTAVFVAAYCVILLVLLWRLKQGVVGYQDFLNLLRTPWSVGFHVIALVFAIYHTVTWFNLLPKVIVLRSGEEKIPGVFLVAGHYLAWILVSVLLVWLVFGQ